MYNTKAFMKNQIIIDENAHIMPSDITIEIAGYGK